MKKYILLLALLPAFAQAQFTDSFNRTDEVLDASANWDRGGETGGQEVSIVSNQLETTDTLSARRLYRSPDQSNADQYVQADIITLVDRPANSQAQIALRATDRVNYIGLGISSSGNIEFGKRIANVWTGFHNQTESGVTALKIEAEGNEIRAYYKTTGDWVLLDSELGVTDLNTETRAGIVVTSGTAGKPLFDNYENGEISEPTAFVDWVQAIEDHFDVAVTGTNYYFNSDATGADDGTSHEDAFTTCGQVDAKNFNAGDNLYFLEDQATVCNVKIKNDTMNGTGAGNPFNIDAYHMVGGVETVGLSGGPYSNTPGGRPCLDGGDPTTFDYYGTMSDAEIAALIPTPNGNKTGVLEGVLNWYQAANYDLDLHIKNLCVRYSGGRHIRFTQTGSAVGEWLLLENSYFEGSMTQSVHLSGIKNGLVQDNYFTRTDMEQDYQTFVSNTQACLAFKGTTGDPDSSVYVAFKRNFIYQSYCSEGVQSNSGGRSVLIEDNVIVDAGHVAGIYLDRTNDMTVRRNIMIKTAKTEHNLQTGALDWGGVVVQNEESCGSFDWCSAYSDPADFAAYATQNAVISDNIVAGWRYNYTFQSQASGKAGNTHTGEDHGACVYFYNNLSLDPDDRHFSINNPSPLENYSLRTDCAPRVWGNAFVNLAESAVDVERNDTQFETVFDANYFSNDITVKSSYDQNITQTGMTFPLSDYSDMSSYMTLDADQWMSYDNARDFLTQLGINPDNLADRDLDLFRPATNVSSGVSLSALTFPTENITGEPDSTDAEGNTHPATVYFGPFATVGSGASSGTLLLRRRRH